MAAGRPGDPTAGRVSFADYVNERGSRTTCSRRRPGRATATASTGTSCRSSNDEDVRHPADPCARVGARPGPCGRERGDHPAAEDHFVGGLHDRAHDFVIVLHPCKGVKTPTVAVKEYRIVTPAEFDVLLTRPSVGHGAAVRRDGDRFGAALGRAHRSAAADLHAASGIVTITRDVVELSPKFHPEGGRFLVKPCPRASAPGGSSWSRNWCRRCSRHVGQYGLGPDRIRSSGCEHVPVACDRAPAARCRGSRPYRAECGRPDVHARLAVGLHRRTVPVPALPRCVCRVPRVPASRPPGPAPRRPGTRHRRPPAPRLVPPARLAARVRRGRPRSAAAAARPTPLARLLAARRRRRPPGRQGAPRPRLDRHDRQVSAHPADSRRNRPRRAAPHPRHFVAVSPPGGARARRSPRPDRATSEDGQWSRPRRGPDRRLGRQRPRPRRRPRRARRA